MDTEKLSALVDLARKTASARSNMTREQQVRTAKSRLLNAISDLGHGIPKVKLLLMTNADVGCQTNWPHMTSDLARCERGTWRKALVEGEVRDLVTLCETVGLTVRFEFETALHASHLEPNVFLFVSLD